MGKNDNEVSQIVKNNIDNVSEELQKLLPDFDMMPKQNDAEVKQAIMSISPQGLERLYQKFGRQQVTDCLSDFSRNRRWD